jgi:hypothetical protein
MAGTVGSGSGGGEFVGEFNGAIDSNRVAMDWVGSAVSDFLFAPVSPVEQTPFVATADVCRCARPSVLDCPLDWAGSRST